jgi:mannose-6-phosphate isomerase
VNGDQMELAFLAPLRLGPNRVYRFYSGGRLLDQFRGSPHSADTAYPEDWVGSVTEAVNPQDHAHASEGLSIVEAGGAKAVLRDLLHQSPAEVAGADIVERFGTTTGLLVKLLDASRRLPVHVHPSRSFAQHVLGSVFGKAEAWIIVGTRRYRRQESPVIHLGFREAMSRGRLRQLVDDQDSATLLASLNAIPVQEGDVFFIRPGLPHAIGAGVFLMEVQEPTDLLVVLEWSGYPISPDDAHLGRGWEIMLDCVDRAGVSGFALEELRPKPSIVGTYLGVRVETLLGPNSEEYFRAFHLDVHGRGPWPFAGAYAVGIVTRGRGEIRNGAGSLTVRHGDSFAVISAAPAADLDGEMEMTVFLPPKPLDDSTAHAPAREQQ